MLLRFLDRSATPDDAGAIPRIDYEGLVDRAGTFETRQREPEAVRHWCDSVRVDGTSNGAVVVERRISENQTG